MATLQYSQTGITSDMIEDMRRRQRERGQRAPYAPSMNGLSEQDTETAINRAQVGEQDVGEAVQQVRQQANMRLRAPMSDSQPTAAAPLPRGTLPMPEEQAAPMQQAPQAPVVKPQTTMQSLDDRDRALMDLARRRQRGVAIAGVISTLFGERENDAQRMQMIAAARDANDPQQFQASIDARAATAQEAEEAKRAASIEDEERALTTQYRQTLMRSMDTNADRREFEMTRRTDADSRLYDPNSPQARASRDLLRMAIASAPDDMYAAFSGIDVEGLGARDIQDMTDRVLRRIGQVPMRERTTEQQAVLERAAALGGVAPEQAEAPVEEAPVAPRGGPRRAVAPGTAPMAPEGAVEAPTPRRDRTLDQMAADVLAERYGQPTSTGGAAREFTPGERQTLARMIQSRRAGVRQTAQQVAGISTVAQEAGIAQTQQTGAFTNRDIDRAAEVLAPAASQRRQVARLSRQVSQMSDAQFAAAMTDRAWLQRLFNVEEFTGAFRAMTNSQLRQQSGAAVTDGEAQRFFAALSAGSLNSKAAFMAALRRVDAEILSNANGMVRPEVRSAWAARQRGSR
jgi:hypothetical protein